MHQRVQVAEFFNRSCHCVPTVFGFRDIAAEKFDFVAGGQFRPHAFFLRIESQDPAAVLQQKFRAGETDSARRSGYKDRLSHN